MDTKTIIAMVLMVIIYFYFFAPTPNQTKTTQSSPQATSSELANETESRRSDSFENVQTTKDQASNQLRKQSFQLKNDRLALEVNALGEVLKVELLNYFEEIDSTENVAWDFRPIEAFNIQDLIVSSKSTPWRLQSSTENEIILEAKQDSGIFSRSISLEDSSYVLKIVDRIENKDSRSMLARVDIQLRKEMNPEKMKRSFFNPYGDIQEAVWSKEDSLGKESFETVANKLSQGIKVDGQLEWAGFSTRYFFLGIVPENSYVDSFQISAQNLAASDRFAREVLVLSEKQIEPNSSASFEYKYYFGPKKLEELKKAGHSLEHVIDYTTMIGFITKPISRLLLTLLLFFQSIVKNYGLAIILLTVLVKMLLVPLAWKASLGMRKMAQVQPKMAEIRERYKSDPQRMQAETMRLWKEEKANPFGSCLPMLVQIPVFFSLYPVFFVSIEMRHAGFFGWINDLSARDPYFILPIVLTVVMYAQQKLSPQPGTNMSADNEAIKVQKAMFKVMPIMMGAFSLFMPAGLSLYILVNVLFSFVQQYFFNKRLDDMFPNPIPAVIEVKKSNGNSA